MLAVDPDPPNPISSFLRTLTLNDSRESLVLPIIEDTGLDLSDLGLEEVFMMNDEPCHYALDTCKSIKMDGTRHHRKKKKELRVLEASSDVPLIFPTVPYLLPVRKMLE